MIIHSQNNIKTLFINLTPILFVFLWASGSIYQSFFFLSIAYGISLGLLSIILGIQPVITPIIAKEKLSKPLYLVLILAFVGLIITILGYRKIEGFSYLGIIFAFVSVFSFSIGNVIQKDISCSKVNILKIQSVLSSFLFLIPLFLGQWNINLTYQFSVALAWMVFIISIGATLLLLFMLKESKVSRVSSLFFCVPPLTIFFEFIFYTGKITVTSILGTILTIISVRMFFLFTSKKNMNLIKKQETME